MSRIAVSFTVEVDSELWREHYAGCWGAEMSNQQIRNQIADDVEFSWAHRQRVYVPVFARFGRRRARA